MAVGSAAGVGSSTWPPVIQKPAINWGELSSPLETTANKTSRRFGQFLVVLGICAGVSRQLAAARMTASPDIIIQTCTTLQVVMIVSLVAGAVLWFFNRLTKDPSLLLCQRREVQNQIETTALADLREKYKDHFVLSDAELNQWIRYLAVTVPFNNFMEKQSDKIFNLPLDGETTKLLRGQYLLYVQEKAPSFKKFIAERALQVLVSDQDRPGFIKSVANHRADPSRSGVVDASSYRKFIEAQGVSIISHLNLKTLQSLVQGFCSDAQESGVGILDLKKNRAEELQVFQHETETWLFQQVANREGLQLYEVFRTRNGDEAVGYITDAAVKDRLFGSFSDFVVGQKNGLVKTREDFERTIVLFGEGALERIFSRVLTDEIDVLIRGELTYLNFRGRNGIGAIQFSATGNSNLIQLLKAGFLRLPVSDLIDPAYAVDRNLFGITLEDVQSELLRRWNGMTFAQILQTDRKGFVAAVAGPNRCFDPRGCGWTQKAVQETAAMSIKDILSTYRVLFTTGVLTANDGDFKKRLIEEIAHITKWTTLIDTYGAFVFEQELLGSPQVGHLVSNFIRIYADSYLNDSFEEAMSHYVQVIQTFCMHPSTAQKIKDAKSAVAAEKQKYVVWLKSTEADFKRRIQERNDAANQEVAKFQSDYRITEKESAKQTAESEFLKKKAAFKALKQDLNTCQEDIDRTRATHIQKSIALEELRIKQRSIPANTAMKRMEAEETLRQAQFNLQNAGHSSQLLKVQLEGLQKEEGELQRTLQKIEDTQKQHTTLSDEVNNPGFAQRKREFKEKIAHADKPVTGLKAAEEAKKAVQEARTRLAEMSSKEERLAELTRGLSQTNAQSIRARLTQIQLTKVATESTLATVETRAGLPQLRAQESRALEAVRQWRALEEEFQSLSGQIATVSLDFHALGRQIKQKTGALEEKADRCEESRLQFLAAKANKRVAELDYTMNAERLAESTVKIRQECTRDIERMRTQQAQLLSQAQSMHAQALQGIIHNFKSVI